MMTKKRLTDADLARLEPKNRAYSVSLGKNLRLFVLSNGTKKFKSRISQRLVLIGRLPDLDLAEAHDMLSTLKGGQESPPFRVLADKFIEKKRLGGSGARNLARFNGLLNNHILPVLADIQINHVAPVHITQIMDSMVEKHIINSAHRALDCIISMLYMAIGLGWCKKNPAVLMKTTLPKKPPAESYKALRNSP